MSNTGEDRLIDVSVEGGKYHIIMPQTGPLHAYRHGEEWNDLTGDKMAYAMASELQEAREERDRERAQNTEYRQVMEDLLEAAGGSEAEDLLEAGNNFDGPVNKARRALGLPAEEPSDDG